MCRYVCLQQQHAAGLHTGGPLDGPRHHSKLHRLRRHAAHPLLPDRRTQHPHQQDGLASGARPPLHDLRQGLDRRPRRRRQATHPLALSVQDLLQLADQGHRDAARRLLRLHLSQPALLRHQGLGVRQ